MTFICDYFFGTVDSDARTVGIFTDVTHPLTPTEKTRQFFVRLVLLKSLTVTYAVARYTYVYTLVNVKQYRD